MLVLTRKRGEAVIIDGKHRVRVLDIRSDKVRLGFDVDRDVSVHREEIELKIQGASDDPR